MGRGLIILLLASLGGCVCVSVTGSYNTVMTTVSPNTMATVPVSAIPGIP